jgi:hypothetical protein
MAGLKPSRRTTPPACPWEWTMPDLASKTEVSPVHHLPIIKAYADQLGLVGLINP